MADVLITSGTLITMDRARRIIEDGAVAITGNRIVDNGTSSKISARHTAPRTIDAARKAVMPGLIDGHAHAAHGLIKTMGGGRSDLWYDACEQDASVTVCLGSDATAPDRSGDMFRHMQQCMHYHRTHFKDPDVLPPGRVLEMTTIDAAHALGVGREIGSLEVGKKADIILVDLARPHLYPLNMPAYRVTCFANGNDVDTVIVGGRILMEGRVVSSVAENRVLEAAQRECELMLERTGLRHLLAMPDDFFGHTRSRGRH